MKANQHPLYRRWTWMRQAVYNPRCPDYPKNGAIGIEIDPKFDNFWDFVDLVEHKLGPCPGPDWQLGRKNIHGNWTIRNLQWSTHEQVGARLDNAINISYKGTKKNIKAWSRELNINYHTLFERYKRGWSAKDILTRPIR